MFAKINSLGLFGLNAFDVDVEIETSRGTPLFEIVGLTDVVVRESRERIKSALRECEISFPLCRVMVNLAPADTKKSGSVHDLAIAVSLLKVLDYIPCNIDNCAFIGEVSLNGNVRGINGVLPMALLASKSGIKKLFVPQENMREASVVKGLTVYGVTSVSQLLSHFDGSEPIPQTNPYTTDFCIDYGELADFCDVKGQQGAKKALEIAAAGGHNALMIGTPGSGKSMLAKRLPSILPAMDFTESIETTNIHSVAGLLNKDTPLITTRPFRSPHHTISPAGLSGGGTIPRPGEISLAHNGVLFLDELAEFPRTTLEILRQPLEDQIVTVSRVSGTATYPCSIMLIAAMNPCPCGYFGHPTRKCICSKKQVSSYLSRISGPLLDRFDLHIEVAPVEYEHISHISKEEPSKAIKERVIQAREIQRNRFKGTDITCNARITSNILHDVCVLDKGADDLLKNVFDKMGLSARSYDRILKVARTVADMDNSEIITKRHIAQSVQYRSLDRKYWQ